MVEDLGVIERAELELDAGSSALTGETGAGKTLLVSAMALILGDRADRSLIRHGAEAARVEARFEVGPTHPAAELLRERDLMDPGATEIVVSRAISEGGGKVRVNGRLATVSLLAELGPLLVEIAGQHEHQRLGSRREQTRLLDSYSGPDAAEIGHTVAALVRDAAAADRRARELVVTQRDTERELDVLRYEISEIEAAGVRPGELDELQVEAQRLEHAEAIGSALGDACTALDGERAAIDLVRDAVDAAARVTDRDPDLVPLVRRLESVAIELDDVARELGGRVPQVDEAALDEIRDRLASLARLQRKYGDEETAVLEYLDGARSRVEELGGDAFDGDAARAAADRLREEALSAAGRLSEIRRAAAARFEREVQDTLGSLAMGDTQVEVALEPVELYEGGLESVELRISSPGHAPRPIAKVASGGELSRIALALRLAAKASEGAPRTLIFDEVDAGVGGEAARAVGRCLTDLSRAAGVQVLVVTHLPQVAAFAGSHHRVKKVTSNGAVTAVVDKLTLDDRVSELSRMLAGLPGSDTARDHAQELLEIAAAS